MRFHLSLTQTLPTDNPTAFWVRSGGDGAHQDWPVTVLGPDRDTTRLLVDTGVDLLEHTSAVARSLQISYGRSTVQVAILTIARAEGASARSSEDRLLPATGDPLPWILNTMRRNAPILSFHPDEKYFTYNVPDYLQNVQLYDARGKLLAQPPLTPQSLPTGTASQSTYLNIPDDRSWIKAGDPKKTKIYVHALQWTHGRFTGADFQYFFFYPYNGTSSLNIRFPGIPQNDIDIPAGAHQGDWESIIVRTDCNGNVIGVYCNQHGSGQWYLPGQLEWREGHPVIYVARSGHPSFSSVGHFPTHGGDFTISILGYTIGVQLDNVTGRGLQLATADAAELVATSYFDGVSAEEPWWLDYLGRFGQVVFTEKDKQGTVEILVGILGTVLLGSVARMFADAITDKVFGILGEIEPDGPEPPKAKGWWNTIRDDGPWGDGAQVWSGNNQISHVVAPLSRDHLALAAFGSRLCMAFRADSSNILYSAWYDGNAWVGNDPIQVAANNWPASTHGPALAGFGGRLYMAFKAADSSALYFAWFDGTRWQGNVPVNTDRGLAASTGAPALAAYQGQLYMAFKAADSNELYLSIFDGSQWRGNSPIQTDHGVPASTGSPALAVYNGLLHLTFKAQDSDQLYAAYFDGASWHGNTPIITDAGPATSPISPWMAPFGGELFMCFKGSDSDYIYLCKAYAQDWTGNQRLSRTTPISPLTSAPGAMASLGDRLIMVFKGADSNHIYQVECKRSDAPPRVIEARQIKSGDARAGVQIFSRT